MDSQNVASKVLTWKNALSPGGHVFEATKPIFKLIRDEDQTINVASRVLTRFYYSHLRKMPAPWSPYNIEINLLTKKYAPPLGSHVYRANVTIFELIQDIIETNLLTKFHEDWK
ncbi:hypothetical protein DPMN_072365 [Dreissena polymorpha]|uniref:Uncharacterized protein n=1 Tax=Dreissena polymorpha TaxID=45954 RepID=A0A9D3Z3U4_DREPO|nr:hypothetical protein DPMN_072365 [Dreissena polymorpha]